MIKDFLTLDIIQFVCLWVVYQLKWYQVPDSMIHGEIILKWFPRWFRNPRKLMILKNNTQIRGVRPASQTVLVPALNLSFSLARHNQDVFYLWQIQPVLLSVDLICVRWTQTSLRMLLTNECSFPVLQNESRHHPEREREKCSALDDLPLREHGADCLKFYSKE